MEAHRCRCYYVSERFIYEASGDSRSYVSTDFSSSARPGDSALLLSPFVLVVEPICVSIDLILQGAVSFRVIARSSSLCNPDEILCSFDDVQDDDDLHIKSTVTVQLPQGNYSLGFFASTVAANGNRSASIGRVSILKSNCTTPLFMKSNTIDLTGIFVIQKKAVMYCKFTNISKKTKCDAIKNNMALIVNNFKMLQMNDDF